MILNINIIFYYLDYPIFAVLKSLIYILYILTMWMNYHFPNLVSKKGVNDLMGITTDGFPLVLKEGLSGA